MHLLFSPQFSSGKDFTTQNAGHAAIINRKPSATKEPADNSPLPQGDFSLCGHCLFGLSRISHQLRRCQVGQFLVLHGLSLGAEVVKIQANSRTAIPLFLSLFSPIRQNGPEKSGPTNVRTCANKAPQRS
ncbi:MAG: hypothetical protein CSA33_04215 [Desulfobulbus propionicus]|nr:MAG: hypothetical protein CSA33_04215 [Desulfobulbus propionicus]